MLSDLEKYTHELKLQVDLVIRNCIEKTVLDGTKKRLELTSTVHDFVGVKSEVMEVLKLGKTFVPSIKLDKKQTMMNIQSSILRYLDCYRKYVEKVESIDYYGDDPER